MLNIGCGKSYHPDWINCDINPVDSEVIWVDVGDKLPFKSSTFDVCYSSHVIEHLEKNQVSIFLDECYRVLRPGGIIRLAVPNLESLVTEYLRVLNLVMQNNVKNSYEYEWLMLELYDQCTRNRSGGMMKEFIRNLPTEFFPYVRSRVGFEFDEIIGENFESLRNNKKLLKLDLKKIGSTVNKLRVTVAMTLVYLVAGKRAYQNSKNGIFRGDGEIHQWMYDRYSIGKVLNQARFDKVAICKPGESSIFEFEKYSLEVYEGKERKPDSLYIEAFKP